MARTPAVVLPFPTRPTGPVPPSPPAREPVEYWARVQALRAERVRLLADPA